jgi:hypothetical protein
VTGRVNQADLLLLGVHAPQFGRDGVQNIPLLFRPVGYPRKATHGLTSGVSSRFYRLKCFVINRVGQSKNRANDARLAALRVADDDEADMLLGVRRRRARQRHC